MKKVLFISLAVLSLAACVRHDDDIHFDNRVYLTGSTLVEDIRVGEDAALLTRSLSVSMAAPEAGDVTVILSVDEDRLSTYRTLYGDPDAVLLPEANYDFPVRELTLAEGFVQSAASILTFKGVNALDLSRHYVLPVSITSAGVGILSSGRTLYFVFSKASLVNVVADLTENRAWPEWKDPAPFKDMPVFTLEALVNATTFKRTGSDGNKIASPLATIMGIEDRFLIRVGDTLIPDNQVQVAYAQQDGEGSTKRGHLSNAAMQLKTGRWYHIAVTFDHGVIKCYIDGDLKGEASSADDMGVETVDFSTEHSEENDGKPRCFWIGYSYDQWRYWNGRISEARIWNKALTAAEINALNHFYQVDPASDGLIAYWKFDDGAGSTVKDYSPLGNDLTSQLPLSWYPVSLPEN